MTRRSSPPRAARQSSPTPAGSCSASPSARAQDEKDGPFAADIVAAERLARLAREYAIGSGRVLDRWSNSPVAADERHDACVEVLRSLQSRIYFNVMRAVVGQALIAAGVPTTAADADLCAMRAVSAAARARRALTRFDDPSGERERLLALLDAIARELEARFPHLTRKVERGKAGGHHADEIRSAGRLVSRTGT